MINSLHLDVLQFILLIHVHSINLFNAISDLYKLFFLTIDKIFESSATLSNQNPVFDLLLDHLEID